MVTSNYKCQLVKLNPSPPIGPALGQKVNIMAFCKEFNAASSSMEPGLPVPVEITVYNDKSFTFHHEVTTSGVLILRKAAGAAKGSGVPNKTKSR